MDAFSPHASRVWSTLPGSRRPLTEFSPPLHTVGCFVVLHPMGHVSKQGFDVVVGDFHRRNDQSGDRLRSARRRYYDDAPGPDVFVVNVEHIQYVLQKVHSAGQHNGRWGFHRNDGLVLGFIRLKFVALPRIVMRCSAIADDRC